MGQNLDYPNTLAINRPDNSPKDWDQSYNNGKIADRIDFFAKSLIN